LDQGRIKSHALETLFPWNWRLITSSEAVSAASQMAAEAPRLPDRFASLLAGGDRRSIGRANTVAAKLAREPDRLDELWTCLTNPDPLIRMRAADALEKFSRVCPVAFNVHKAALLEKKLDDGSAEVRWHLIAITSRIALERQEAEQFCRYLHDCLRNDPSRIVKVMALQAAKDLQVLHPSIEAQLAEMIRFAQSSIWPSVAARARKLASANIKS